MNLEELIKLFLDSRRRGMTGARKKCAATTVQIYAKNLKVFSNFILSELEGDSITDYKAIKRLHIVQFLDWMDKQQSSTRWSRATVLQILRSMRAFFRWVDKDEDCREDGLAGLQRWLPAIEKTPRRSDMPEFKDIKKLKTSFDTDRHWDYRNYVAVCLMLTNGIRVGELCSLRLDGIKWDQNIIFVTGKKGPRTVLVTDDALRLLRGWIKRRARCKQGKDSPYVFVNKNRPQMTANSVDQMMAKMRKKYNLPRITPHTLRHMFCTDYLRHGGDMEKLRLITGHEDYQILKDYLHLARLGGKSAQEELERVNRLREV